MKLFGTDGVRGTYGNFPMDNPTIKKIGLALSKILDNNIKTLSIVPSGNNIEVYTNVGRTDGDTNKGDIKECSATVID